MGIKLTSLKDLIAENRIGEELIKRQAMTSHELAKYLMSQPDKPLYVSIGASGEAENVTDVLPLNIEGQGNLLVVGATTIEMLQERQNRKFDLDMLPDINDHLLKN